MAETYIITAKTVEEAIAIAKREYENETHEVSYEIIDMPKKGFLGLGSKDAKIKITVTKIQTVELGSLVADIKNMKTLTSKGENHEKSEKKQNKPTQQNKPKNPQPPKQEPKPEPQKEQKQETKQEQKPESYSALGNQAKSKNRRPQQKKTTENNTSTANSSVSVASPMGLSDFKSEPAKEEAVEFRPISNDIKKKNKITDPSKANADALKALTAPLPKEEKTEKSEKPAKIEKPEATEEKSADPAEHQSKNKKRRDKRKNNNHNRSENPEQNNTPNEDIPKIEEKRLKEAVSQAEMDFAIEFANTLLANMQLEAKAVPASPEDGEEFITKEGAEVYPKINIVGDDTGILIGHHGETLDAIQYLVNLSAVRRSKQKDGDYIKIVVDIEGYREKREETLRALARRMANRAVKYKRNVFLEPMNAYERRIIHSELQTFENVSTHSVGSDKDRKIIITYEGEDKKERQPRERHERAEKNERTDKTESRDKTEQSTSNNTPRPKKHPKLSIDQLDALLDSREEDYIASIPTTETPEVVTRIEEIAEKTEE